MNAPLTNEKGVAIAKAKSAMEQIAQATCDKAWETHGFLVTWRWVSDTRLVIFDADGTPVSEASIERLQ